MEIFLYSALSPEIGFRTIKRNMIERIKIFVHRVIDIMLVRFFPNFQTRFFHWKDYDKTNRGDQAISMAIAELISRSFPEIDITFTTIAWSSLTSERIAHINSVGALFIIAGGGYYMHDTQGKLAKRCQEDLRAFAKIEIPMVGWGLGFNKRLGPQKDPADKAFLHTDAAQVIQAIDSYLLQHSVRDHYSQVMLYASAGIKRTVPVHADPALFLTPEPVPAPPPASQLRVGLNFAFHGPFCENLFNNYLSVYISFLKHLDETGRYLFWYFAHSDSERYVYSSLRISGVPCEVIEGSPAVMVGYYAHLDAHICQMMHSSVFSINRSVPTLNIAYDIKNVAFFELMNMQSYCLNVHDVNEQLLLERFECMIENRAAIRNQLKLRKENLAQEIKPFIAELSPLLHRTAK